MKKLLFFTFLSLLVFTGCPDEEPQPPCESPTLGLLVNSDSTGNFEVYKYENDERTQLTNDPTYESWWARSSPADGSIIFYRSPAPGKDNDYDRAGLWKMDADGANQREIIPEGAFGWTHQGTADWSPDGQQLVMTAIDNTGHWHIFITNNEGENPQKISTRNSLYADPSFSPDGEKIVFTGFPENYLGNPLDWTNYEIHTMNVDGTNETRLTFDNIRDHDPYFSPDGTEIAFESEVEPFYLIIGQWAIRKIPAAGGEIEDVINDGHINGVVSWSEDSEEIYFPRAVFGVDRETTIFKIKKDGSDLVNVIPGNSEFQYINVSIIP